MKPSYPTSEALKFLLQMAHNREMALPDFQRDFVWDPSATNELIESIISKLPRRLTAPHKEWQPAPVSTASNRGSASSGQGSQTLVPHPDDFEGFLTYREKLVMQLVQEKTAA